MVVNRISKMGARGGGGGRGGRGGAGGGSTTVFTGGFDASRGEVSNIVIGSIDRMTDKALQVTTLVNWANGSAKQKQIWVPKSTVVNVTKSNGTLMLNMSKSMASSISNSNSFKGYPMEFTNSNNA